MNENQVSPNNLLDTTDCLEAVGVFKGWKNFFFVIIVLCLLLLQTLFLLVDTDTIEISKQAVGGEPAIPRVASEPNEVSLEVTGETEQDVTEPEQEVLVEPNQPVESVPPVEPVELVEPNEAVEPNEPDEPVEPNETIEPNEPIEIIDPNEPAEPNTLEQTEPNQPIQLTARAVVQGPQSAIAWAPMEFLSGITPERLAWLISFINAILILTATLYCLTLLFSLKVSMLGRLGGINHISRAFFLSLLMLVLILPWQRIFGNLVVGAIYTPDELVEWSAAETDDMFKNILYYLRFSGYSVLILLLLILSQFRSYRWAKAILRRLEII